MAKLNLLYSFLYYLIMAKCPHCDLEIDHVDYDCQEYDYGRFFGNGEWSCKGPGDIVEGTLVFTCPECGEEIVGGIEAIDALFAQDEEIE